MTIMYSDEVLAEMIKLTEKQSNKSIEKEAHQDDLRIDMSQFSLASTPEDDGLSITSFPMMQNVVVATDYDGQDKELLKEKKKATDFEDIIEQAHPETAFMADGPMGTGVVENQNEQHTKILNVIYKMPTGFHFNTFAELVQDLTVLAERLEAKGDLEAVRKVDETLAVIAAAKKKRLKAEAAAPEKRVPPGMKRPHDYALPGEMPSKTPKPGTGMVSTRPGPGTSMVPSGQTGMVSTRPGPGTSMVPSGQTGMVSTRPGGGKAPMTITMGPDGRAKLGPAIKDVTPKSAPKVKVEPGAQQFRPGNEPDASKPDAAKGKPAGEAPEKPKDKGKGGKGKPSKPSGKKNFFSGMMAKLKGVKTKGKVGMAAALAAAIGGGIYALWQSTKTDWDRYLSMAEDEAASAGNTEAKVLVADIERRHEEIDEMMSSVEDAKSLEVSQYLKIDNLISKIDELSKYSNISSDMAEAAQGLSSLAAALEEQGSKYLAKGVKDKEDVQARSAEKVQSMKQWFADHGDQDITVDGNVDDRLTFHIRGFISNMKKRFGPAFNPKSLSENNLTNHGNYELLDRLYQIWKYPRAAIGEE